MSRSTSFKLWTRTPRNSIRFDVSKLDRAEAHLERLLPNEAMLLQPYLSRVESEGEGSVIFVDGELTHAVRKLPVPGDYRVQDDFGASDEPWLLSDAEAELARRVVDCVGQPLLYARVDFLRDDAGELRVNELELVEPSLFFRHGPHAAPLLAKTLMR